MIDSKPTHCPYCNPPYNGKYAWRVVLVDSVSYGVPSQIETIKAVEIYCTQCRATLSITPLVGKGPQAQ